MRSRFCLPVLLMAALALAGDCARAGSFLGPCCYGARYTRQYPNRSHNTFGSYPCCPCPAWHPFFRPGLSVRKPNAAVDGMPRNGLAIPEMPAAGTATPDGSARIAPLPAAPHADSSAKPPF